MKKFLLPIVFFLTSFNFLGAQETSDRIRIVKHFDTLKTQLRVNIEDGNVALGDVFRVVSRFNGYDDTELQFSLPRGRVPMNSRRARWSIAAINRVLQPCVNVARDGDALAITVDRKSARNWMNSAKSDVRWAWNKVDWRSEPQTYGIEFAGKIDPGACKDIVLIIHGLNSRPEDVIAFVPLAEQAGHDVAMLRYPNDQPIDESAKFLALELAKLANRYPNRKVRLLTHSMGGLVARAAIETDLDPGNVKQLIMIGPPNHGSSLARIATFMDCYECFTSPDYRRSGVLVESVADGLGEATADLEPHSVFLDELNQYSRNNNVSYTILLGTDGPMNSEEMKELREAVRDASDRNRFTRFVSSKLNRALDGLDEVVAGKGDGAVSCERGRLTGVTDVVELPFSHAGILGPYSDGAKQAYNVITERLGR